MKKTKKKTLVQHLIWSFFLFCMLPLAVVIFILYYSAARSLEASSMELASVFCSQIVMSIEDFEAEYDMLTKSFLPLPEVVDSIEGAPSDTVLEKVERQSIIYSMMRRVMTQKSSVKNVVLITNYDTFVLSQLGEKINISSLYEQEWYQKIMKEENNIMLSSIHSQPYLDRHSDQIVLTIGRRLYNYAGKYIGVILLDVDPASFVDLSEGFFQARDKYDIKISITNKEDEIIYDSDVVGSRSTWEEASKFNEWLLTHEEQTEYLVFIETLENGLNINTIIPRDTLLHDIDQIGTITLEVLLVCLFISIGLSITTARFITKPLRQLQGNMRQAEQGQYETMTNVARTEEVESLINSYNQMIVLTKTLIEDVYLAEIEEKNAKYLALQTQINPHMLYNTLDSIRMKALLNNDDEVAEMIKILAGMFRLALQGQKHNYTVRDEVEYAEHYIKLQNMRYEDIFFLDVDLAEEILNTHIITSVFQPIIENGIKHGFRGNEVPLHITIIGEIIAGDVLLHFKNDGKEINSEEIEMLNQKFADTKKMDLRSLEEQNGEKSIGLKNIAERIRIYYGEKYYLKIVPKIVDGVMIDILIPGNKENT